jgi:hypothetical protein
MHACPSCGYDGHENPPCLWCGADVAEDDNVPYCSHECALAAELETV